MSDGGHEKDGSAILVNKPSSDWGHHRVAQVVLPVGRFLDVGPFELVPAAAEE